MIGHNQFKIVCVSVALLQKAQQRCNPNAYILLKFAFKTQTFCNKKTEILHNFATKTHTFCNQST